MEKTMEKLQWKKRGEGKAKKKLIRCVGRVDVLPEIPKYLRTVQQHEGKMNVEEAHDVH